MPPNPPHDRSPLPRAPYSQPAPFSQSRATTEGRSTSYSSLEQALVLPAASRDASDRRAHQPPRDAHRSGPGMSSEGRYMAYSPSEVPPQYGYNQYSSYDPAQYPPSASRPVRSSAPQPHPPPPQQAQQPPPSPYAAQQPPPHTYSHPPPAPQYSGPPFPVPSQSWQPENWQPYGGFPAAANTSVPDQQQAFTRPDAQSQLPNDATRAPSAGPSNPDKRRADDRADRPPDAPPPTKSRKTREAAKETAPPLPAALDYVQLVDSYRLILDTTNFMGSAGHVEGIAERVEQMLQAAKYGADAIAAAAAERSAPEPPRAGPAALEHPTNEPEGGGTGKARQGNAPKSDQHVEGGQTCLGCSATSTPEWRRGPLGPRTLCNACGLVYAKLVKKRTREPRKTRNKQSKQSHADAVSSGEDGSDADSSGSHEKRNDMGEASRRG